MAGERTLPGLGLTAFWNLGDNTFKTGLDSNLRMLSALVQPSVLSVVSSAPGAPEAGDLHIASSAWAGGAANDIMAYDFDDFGTAAWIAISPMEGWQVYNRETGERLLFDGSSWVALEGSKFLGTYVSLSALETAHAVASPGNYADVDAGVGIAAVRYIWDADDSGWVQTGGASDSGGLSLVNDTSGARTLSDSDLAGNIVIEMASASAQTLTVNTGLTGTEPVTIINSGGGALTFNGTATIQSAGGLVAVNTQYASVTLIPKGSDTYYLVGALE